VSATNRSLWLLIAQYKRGEIDQREFLKLAAAIGVSASVAMYLVRAADCERESPG
jgi:hypothetical protein